MENVYVISHASDIDGVGSAALIRMKYGVPLKNLFFSEYTEEAVDYVNGRLSPHYRKRIMLFIADLGVDDHLIDSYLKIIRNVKRYGGRVFWFDHHPWTDDAIAKLASECDRAVVGENPNYCATEITYLELGFDDSFINRFTSLVHYSDFNLKPKTKEQYDMIGAYTLSITSYGAIKSRDLKMRKLRHVAEVISRRRFLDGIIKDDASRFRKINEDRTEQMLKGLVVRKDFAVGFSKGVQSTAGCIAVREKAGRQIGVYINTTEWKGHIRCETKDISILAMKLGGGGHPHAAGFPVDPKGFGNMKSKAQKERFVDFLESMMRQFVS